ncbi:MAG: hypothetical protein WD036_01290 [Bauldia sp.]
MNRQSFEEGLSRYGGDLKRWPDELRGEAEALVADDEAAAAMLGAARRLDGMLAAIAAPQPVGSAMLGRIIAGIGNGTPHDLTVRPTGRLFAWASTALAAFLVAGFVAGVALPADQGEDAFAGLMFGTSADSATVTDDPEGGVL